MAQKQKKDDGADYRKLKRDLSEGTLGQLYVFYGEEAYLRDHYLEQMKKKLIPPGLESFNYQVIGGKSCTARILAEAVDCLPMMSPRTMIVVTDYDLYRAPEEERGAMADLFADLPDYCCLIFVYDILEYKSDARLKKLAGALKTYGSTVQFARQEQGDLVDWIHRRFRAMEHDIDSADAQYLIFLCGDLMNGLISEIGKIGAYAKNKRVLRSDIDAVAIPQLDAVVFQMSDAVARKDFSKAAEVLGDLLQMQQPPVMILAVLGRQMRQLYTARLAFDRGKDAAYLMSLWGMRSSYPAQKLMESARRFSPKWCRKAVARCAQTDLSMKSVQGADGRDLLITLLLELAAGEGG